MRSKHLRGYTLAASSCLTAALGGTFLDGGTAEIIGGIAMVVSSLGGTLLAMMTNQAYGPDPWFWEPTTPADRTENARR